MVFLLVIFYVLWFKYMKIIKQELRAFLLSYGVPTERYFSQVTRRLRSSTFNNKLLENFFKKLHANFLTSKVSQAKHLLPNHFSPEMPQNQHRFFLLNKIIFQQNRNI